MHSYILSIAAAADIEVVAQNSINRWGLDRAENYVLALHETFRRPAIFPNMGKDAGHIRPGYMRVGSGSHSIFYMVDHGKVFIVRVLHKRMEFSRHL